MSFRVPFAATVAVAVAGLLTLAAPSIASASPAALADVIPIVATPDTGWAGTVEPDGSLVLPPGASELPLYLANVSTSADYQVGASSPLCAGKPVPRAVNMYKPQWTECPVELNLQPGAHGTLDYTIPAVNLQTNEQVTLTYHADYRVFDDRPVISVSQGGTAVPDGGTVSMPLGGVPQFDATVTPSVDDDIVSAASFVSPSPSSCLTVPAVDLDATHDLTCTAIVGPAVQQPTTVTFAAADDSSYRTGALGQATVSYQGTGGCTTSASTVAPGDRLTVSCTGFEPGLRLTAEQHSATPTPIDDGIVVPASGAFTFGYAIPAATAAGSHTVSILFDGTTLFTTDAFTVSGPVLAATGTSVGGEGWLLAGSPIALGLVLFIVARRRSTRRV